MSLTYLSWLQKMFPDRQRFVINILILKSSLAKANVAWCLTFKKNHGIKMFLCQAFNQFFKFFVPMVEISSSEMSKLILIVFFSGVNRHNPEEKKYFHVIAKSCFKSKFRGRTIDIDTNENRKMQKLTKRPFRLLCYILTLLVFIIHLWNCCIIYSIIFSISIGASL